MTLALLGGHTVRVELELVVLLAVACVIAILARRLRLPYTIGLVGVGDTCERLLGRRIDQIDAGTRAGATAIARASARRLSRPCRSPRGQCPMGSGSR